MDGRKNQGNILDKLEFSATKNKFSKKKAIYIGVIGYIGYIGFFSPEWRAALRWKNRRRERLGGSSSFWPVEQWSVRGKPALHWRFFLRHWWKLEILLCLVFFWRVVPWWQIHIPIQDNHSHSNLCQIIGLVSCPSFAGCRNRPPPGQHAQGMPSFVRLSWLHPQRHTLFGWQCFLVQIRRW